MLEYLKYLPLLQVASNHPNLVQLFNQLSQLVAPHMAEIQKAVAEAEALIRQIDPPQPLTKESATGGFVKP
jgi:hypothetical protein